MSSNSENVRPDSYTIPHYRGRDYREHHAHAFMFRIDGDQAILTFYREDTVIRGEQLELKTDEATGFQAYVTTGVDQENFREDVFSVRIPLQNFLLAAQSMGTDVTPQSASEGTDNADAS